MKLKTPGILLLASLFYCCGSKDVADKIYINATMWTGQRGDSSFKAIAVKDSMIVYVGNDFESYKGSNTEIIDAGGAMIIPGFIDNHTHFLSGGYQLASVNFRNVKTPEEFIDSLETFVKKIPADRWIEGGDWDHEIWGGSLPHKNWIDSITPNNPVLVSRYDGHMALANSAALQRAGITAATPDPPGGEIIRDPGTGEPTGVLKDQAMYLVSKFIPEYSDDEMDAYLTRAMEAAWKHGVTQVHDMGSYGGWADLATYRRAHKNNSLDLRIYSFLPLRTWRQVDSMVKVDGRGDNILHWGGLKGFMDGSLGSTTAWFYKPYKDDPSTAGFTVTDTALMRQWIYSADSAGLHLAIHAIGDQANDWLLNCYENVLNGKDGSAKRYRIEHAQHLSTEAIKRFSSMGIIPSMQPYHAIDDGRWAEKRLEDERLQGTYAFKSLLENQAMLTFGSDWTVGPLSPILGIYAAVTRRTIDDQNPGGWYPQQKITVEDALICYTRNNAYAGFMEDKVGILKAGMLADLVMLSDNLFTIEPEKIKDVRVLRTVINGKEVFNQR